MKKVLLLVLFAAFTMTAFKSPTQKAIEDYNKALDKAVDEYGKALDKAVDSYNKALDSYSDALKSIGY